MKNILATISLLLLGVSSQAQTSRGTITFGAGLLQSTVQASADKPTFQASQQSRIGYFVADQVVVGLMLETGINGNKTVPYGFTASGRWYSGGKAHRALRVFVEAGAGVADARTEQPASDVIRKQTNWVRPAAYISPGVSLFLGDVVSLEVAPEYRRIAGENPVDRFGASAGIRFHLSESLFKQLFPNKFVKDF